MAVVLDALEDVVGAGAMILDASLRIVAATPAANRLLGHPARGVLAIKAICRGTVERPVAEALAAGRPVTGLDREPGRRGQPARACDSRRARSKPRRMGPRRGARARGRARRRRAASLPRNVDRRRCHETDVSLVEKVAKSDATVLVRGDTGAGKELVAQALHAMSPRARGPFRAINCAAVPQALLESELFGHAKGAFTGAVRDVPGQFRLADGGTLFLDEVAEMPLDLQSKMLRVLETHEVAWVGERDAVKVDVRIVAATHRPLRREVEAGRFRADLVYRLRVIPIFLPPLRARGDDVILLAEKLVDELNSRGPRRCRDHLRRRAGRASKTRLARQRTRAAQRARIRVRDRRRLGARRVGFAAGDRTPRFDDRRCADDGARVVERSGSRRLVVARSHRDRARARALGRQP